MKLTRVIGLKMSGEDVRFLQSKLKEYGFFNNKVDGNFGQNTLVSVVNFQKSRGIKADGVVGLQTWSQILHYNTNEIKVEQVVQTPQVEKNLSFAGQDGLKIYDNLLNDDEYYKDETSKNTIWLHHTAGGSRPDWTIGGWDKDFQKDEDENPILDASGNPLPLRVATSYVIGRKSSSTNDEYWDGRILKAFDDKYWAYHLGVTRNSRMLNSRSIGIEICNYGPLTLRKDGRYYNYVNKPINDEDVCELDTEFRGHKYWEKYTDVQLESTRRLIIYLKERWNIEIEKGIYTPEWFEYNDKWFTTGGLRTHTQVRKDKFDLFPQPELLQMLNSL